LLLDAVLETVRGIVVDVGKAIAAAPVGRYATHALFPHECPAGSARQRGPGFSLARAAPDSSSPSFSRSQLLDTTRWLTCVMTALTILMAVPTVVQIWRAYSEIWWPVVRLWRPW
jgi:hypothetical protein